MPNDESPEKLAQEGLKKLYPGAGQSQDPRRDTRERQEKVIEGTVTRRKKPLDRRIVEFFTGPQARNLVREWGTDIVAKLAKDMLIGTVDGFRDMLFEAVFGPGPRGTTRSARYQPSRTPYHTMSRERDRDRRFWEEDRYPVRTRHPHNFDDIILETRADAEEVIDTLYNILRKRDFVLVSDLYDAVGEPASYTDENYGWTDLHGTRPYKVREGWLIDIPRPELLD